MKLPRYRIIAFLASFLGIALPFVLLFLGRVTNSAPPVDRAMVALWPTCVLLMASEGREHTFTGYIVFAGVVALNAAVYVVVFTAIWRIAWVLRASRRSLHDGTTI